MPPICAGITLAGFAGAYCAFGVSEDCCRGEEGANRCCDCDSYRPDTLGGGIGAGPFPLGLMGTHRAAIRDRLLQAKRASS